jgi:AbiJ N-terminal domain 4
MAYFIEREGGAKPRVSEDISGAVAGALAALIETRIRDASFGYSYPEMCWEYTSAVVGTDAEALARAVRGYFPDLAWPLNSEQLTGNFGGLDLVEFTFEKVAEPHPRGDNASHAAYASHQHLGFNVADGRARLLDEVNRLFERNGLAFHLEDNGQIVRLAPEVLRQVLAPALFHTGDPHLDELLEAARRTT